MLVNYYFDEIVEFFISILSVNQFWKKIAEEHCGFELDEIPYRQKINSFFEPYKQFKIFKTLKNIETSLFLFGETVKFPFCLKLDEGKIQIKEKNINIFNAYGGKESVGQIIIQMQELYDKSNYHDFFKSLPEHEKFECLSINKKEMIKTVYMSEYFSTEIEKVDVYITPLIFGNFNIKFEEKELTELSTPWYINNEYTFGNFDSLAERFILKVLINNELNRNARKLRIKVKSELKVNDKYFEEYLEQLRETLFEAFYLRIDFILNNQMDVQQELDELYKTGFVNIKKIYSIICQSEENVGQYKINFDSLISFLTGQ